MVELVRMVKLRQPGEVSLPNTQKVVDSHLYPRKSILTDGDLLIYPEALAGTRSLNPYHEHATKRQVFYSWPQATPL
jgi:hypothetical protein